MEIAAKERREKKNGTPKRAAGYRQDCVYVRPVRPSYFLVYQSALIGV